MSYTKNTWIDNNTLFPVSANRLNHMEDGIAEAVNKILVLNSADPIPNGTPPGTIIIRKEA